MISTRVRQIASLLAVSVAVGVAGVQNAAVASATPGSTGSTSSSATTDQAEHPTLVGASICARAPRDTMTEELEFLEGQVGTLEIRRVFDSGFDVNFLNRAGADVGKRATHYSFKPNMAQLASGVLDNKIKAFLASIPAGHRTILTVWHEPEDNFTTDAEKATYRAGWQRFADLVHATDRPELSTSWVMMAWSWWGQSGRNPNDWFPGTEYVDSVGVDTYNEGSLSGTRWDSPGRGLGQPAPGDTAPSGGYVQGGFLNWIDERGLDWGVAEFGSLENTNDIDAAWAKNDTKGEYIRQAIKFYVDNGASYVEYFHCGPYRGPWWLDSSQQALNALKWALERY